MKFYYAKVWEKIAQQFSSRSKNGAKTSDELNTKFKNMKQRAKKDLAHNKREISKTGGGQADIREVHEAFNLRDEQVTGLVNLFDDDSVETSNSNEFEDTAAQSPQTTVAKTTENIVVYVEENFEASVPIPKLPVLAASIVTTPRTGNEFCNRIAKQTSKPTPKGSKEVEHNHAMMEIRKRKAELEVEVLELQLENEKMKMEKHKLEILKLQRDLGLSEETEDQQ